MQQAKKVPHKEINNTEKKKSKESLEMKSGNEKAELTLTGIPLKYIFYKEQVLMSHVNVGSPVPFIKLKEKNH